jgi:hypothetical protein
MNTITKSVVGNTALTMVRIGMIACIVKLTLLWEPALKAADIASVAVRSFVG